MTKCPGLNVTARALGMTTGELTDHRVALTRA
jgi:hypothetical protein